MNASIDTLKRYQRYFKRLIQLERQEEISFHLNEIRSISGKTREKKGRAILDLSSRSAGRGLGGIHLIKLTRQAGIPETEIGTGDLVIVSTGKPNGEEPQGTVVEKTNYSITIAYNNPPPAYIYKRKLRLDLFANDISFQRMMEALFELREHQILSDLLLTSRSPRYHEDDPKVTFIQHQLNTSQKHAVLQTLKAKDCFLIHGPPGTGKTTTLIESAIQHVKAGYRVLATADSNTAVDNTVEKLNELGIKVIRIGNPARVNPAIIHCSLDQKIQEDIDYQQAIAFRDQIFELREEQKKYIAPTGQNRRGLGDETIIKLSRRGASGRGIQVSRIHKMAEWIQIQRTISLLSEEARRLEKKAVIRIIKSAEVVCSTNVSSGSEVLENHRFDVVFIDEATQSMEPSCLIPMIKSSKWILAGDHNQLPPTVLSREASALNYSLFERWMEAYESKISALLTIQYRMHEKIMAFSNRQFYQDRLVAAPKVKRHHIGQLAGFTEPEYLSPFHKMVLSTTVPILFINVKIGFENKIQGSFSYFNKREVDAAEEIALLFLRSKVFPEDIGVISPYDQQVGQIKIRLIDTGIEIKTVDGFQGREKEVIILSLVRANEDGNLGFLTDYRRLNVALTRARRKIILIGNRDTLKKDALYGKLLSKIKILDFPEDHI